MNDCKIAVLLTVFNRKDVTLQGLRLLYKAIAVLGEGYTFDKYMTDDGCSDGTGKAVAKEFPDIHIINGDGKLYWNGGMSRAWQTAVNSGVKYDYYIWFNDDSMLYDNSFIILFDTLKKVGGNAIISGAFCDESGKVSYGGWAHDVLLEPKTDLQSADKVNGNLVLIPKCVFNTIGGLDSFFHHSYGDWEYGIRAKKHGFPLFLTSKYVGKCNRHDGIKKCFNTRVNIVSRFVDLYSPISVCPFELAYYEYCCRGFFYAVKAFIVVHIRCLVPFAWVLK